MDEEALPRRGVLWSFTVQAFRPKSPPFAPGTEAFVPYGVGYVDLGPVVVEGRLTENDPAKLAIGMPVELTIAPFASDDGGETRTTYAFRPAEVEG